MTRQTDLTAFHAILELVGAHGTDAIAEAFAIILNRVMQVERSTAIGADPYERSPNRTGYANGFKPKSVATPVGVLELQVPQVRGDTPFYPSALERGSRADRSLVAAIAEMYIQGVSTRRVSKIVEELCGTEISSSRVSRATKALDDELKAWRERSLGRTPYLMLDARYEKVRIAGAVVNAAVLVAIGVDHRGYRSVLGVSVSTSEAEVHWRTFLKSLVDRGMFGVKYVISDDHAGLRKAQAAVFSGAMWQRCQFHLAQNAMHHTPRLAMRKDVGRDIRRIFRAQARDEADRLLAAFVTKYEKPAPKLTQWAADNIPEGLAVLGLPEEHHRYMRTTNMLERMNGTLRARTRVVRVFPNEDALLRLVSAVLAENDLKWSESDRPYLNHMEA